MIATLGVLAALQALLLTLLCRLLPQSSEALRLLLDDSQTAPAVAALGSALSILVLILLGAVVPSAACLSLARARYIPRRDGLLSPMLIGLSACALVQGCLGRSSAPRWILLTAILGSCALARFIPRVGDTLRDLWSECVRRLPVWMALGVGIELFLLIFGRRLLVDLPIYDDVFRAQFTVAWLAFRPFTNFLNFGGPDLRYYSLLELLTAFHARVLGTDLKQTYFLGLPLALHFLTSAVIASSARALTRRPFPLWLAMVSSTLVALLSATYTQMQSHLFIRQSMAGFLLVLVCAAAFSRYVRTLRTVDFVACGLSLVVLLATKASLGLPMVLACAGLSLFLPLTWPRRFGTSLALLLAPLVFYRWFVQIRMATTAEIAVLKNAVRSGLYQYDALFSLAAPELSKQVDWVQALAAEGLRLHIVFLPVILELAGSLRHPTAALRRPRLPWLLAACALAFFGLWTCVSIKEDTGVAESYWNMCAQFVAASLLVTWLARMAVAQSSRVSPWLRSAVLAFTVWASAVGMVGIAHGHSRDLLWCPVDAPLIRSLREIRRLTPPQAAVLHNIYGDALENFVTTVSERRHAFSFAYNGASVPWPDKAERKHALDVWWSKALAGSTSRPPPLSPRPKKLVLLVRGALPTAPSGFRLAYVDPPYQVWIAKKLAASK